MMSILRMILSLFILQLMASCQVKEASSSGGLISDHVPATNKFIVAAPTAKTYKQGEVIKFTVTYPFDMITDFTGGNPRLAITVGSASRFAVYDSHPNARQLIFNYVVQALDEDTNGIDVNALELNGSVLQFDNKGVLTNCDVTTVTTKNFSAVKVDTIAPTITTFALTNLPGLYNAGKKINFTMQFSEKVFIVGTPSFTLDLTTGGTVNVTYTSGSGTNTIGFSFTITQSHADMDGYDNIDSPLNVGAGSIKDTVGNNANLDFSTLIGNVLTYSAFVRINGEYPYVVNVVTPANGIYTANDNLDFTLQFDREVTVSGIPYIDVTIGSNTRQAQYLSGSGTDLITFRYTAVPGDMDPNGIDVTPLIEQNAGNIVDKANPTISFFDDPANNVLTIPSTAGVIIEAVQPQPISIARNTDTSPATWGTVIDNVWIIGQELNLTVGFNTGIFVNQTSGTPSLSLTIGAANREAIYVSGGNGQTSLLFRYIIQEGDLDTDGSIGIGNIVLNGGVITDSENTNSLLTMPVANLGSTFVDGIRPTILSVTSPTTLGTYSTVAPLTHNQMGLTVTWSENVNYSSTNVNEAYIAIDIGGSTVNADFVTGANSNVLVHTPRSLAGTNCNSQNSCTGIIVSPPLSGTAIIKDQAGNLATDFTFSPPDGTGILVDTTPPTVDSIVPVDLLAKTYVNGSPIDFTVTFTEPVTTSVNATHPRIRINIGGTTRLLLPTASTTSLTHTFRYTVQPGDLDTDGISFIDNRVVSNGTTAYARDAGRNLVAGTFTIPTVNHLTVDADAPTISNVVVPADGSYISGNTLEIRVTYSEDVIVTGTPSITVTFDQGTNNLPLTSATGDTLVFSRLLDGTHFDMTGLNSSITGITMTGVTIEDSAGNPAETTFTTPIDLSNVYVTYPQVKLWVKTPFVNLAPSGVAVLDNGATITTEACGTGVCRSFDGDDELTLSAGINNIDMVYMALKTPPTVTGDDYNLLDTFIRLISDIGSNRYDFATVNAQVSIDGVASGSPHTHNVDKLSDTGVVLSVDFLSSRNLTGTLISNMYTGGIGEIICAEDGMTAPQKANIQNYIENKY